MKLKLFLKQSIKDFIIYWPLYLTFTLFLTFAASLSLGLISFASSFFKDVDDSIGLTTSKNALFKPEPYTVMVPEKDDYTQQEKEDLPIYHFFLDTIEYNKEGEFWNGLKRFNSPQLPEENIKNIYKYFASNSGNISHLKQGYLTELDSNLEVINKYVDHIAYVFKWKFKTNNIQLAFILNQYLNSNSTKKQIENFYFQFYRQNAFNVKMKNVPRNGSLEYLATNEKMGDIHQGYYGDEIVKQIVNFPEGETKITNFSLFQSNDFNRVNFQSSINFQSEQFKNYLDRTKEEFGMFFYLQPRVANDLNLKLGEKYSVNTWYADRTKDYQMVFAGTILNPDIWYRPTDLHLYVPLQTVNKLLYEVRIPHLNNSFQNYWNSAQNVFSNQLHLHFANKNNVEEGQKYFSNWFETNMMTNLKPGLNRSGLQSSTFWAHEDLGFTTTSMMQLVILVSIVVIIFVLILLFLIFFFISQQIILLQQKSLFVLKSMGIRNYELSILNTSALIFPTLISFSLSTFGALMVQSILTQMTYDILNFHHSFWTMGFPFIISIICLFGVSIIGFFVISLLIMNSDVLKISGMGVVKSISNVQMKLKFFTRRFNSKVRLGLSFAFQNVYKNLISYIMLTLSFTILFFAFQFNTSVNYFNYGYEQWNAPYKSIKFNHWLPEFVEYEKEKPIIDSYQNIDVKDLEKYKKLDKVFWKQAPDKIMETLTNGLDKAYIPKATVLAFLNNVSENPKNYEQILNQMDSIFVQNKGSETFKIKNLLKPLIDKLINFRKQFPTFDGINIMFGKVVGSRQASNVNQGKQMGVYAKVGVDRSERTITFIGFENDEFSRRHFEHDVNSEGVVKRKLINGEQTTLKNQWALNASINSSYAKRNNLKIGDEFVVKVNVGVGQPDGSNSEPEAIYHNVIARVNKVLYSDSSSFQFVYVPQASLFSYLEKITQDKKHISEKFGEIAKNINQANPVYVTNSYFSKSIIPMQLEYWTLPIYKSTNGSDKAGSNINDYYLKNHFESYINNVGAYVMIFSKMTEAQIILTRPLSGMIGIAIVMSGAIAVLVSMLITILILLENRNTILLFKIIGYKKREINKYLISGYLVSMMFAILTSVGIVWILLGQMGPTIQDIFYFNLVISFQWTLGFVFLVITSLLSFFILINFAISTYTRMQKPKSLL
ncbi:hypothetical protein ELUMI_v1c02080 [Williamsoniiplasma luminosum]|uniref:ABC transporter permease n=1 Tax=Williamsoniiplasma luminosum TaxID=214888 RepID=A0A2K8NWC1_9MOLU|nr:ABC transporter permease [Williamsoniiplasma luminosum]ATZ16933.1 hypothetical protein ELUMI_v1c02080 [Williamsoniiplasma luminosum]